EDPAELSGLMFDPDGRLIALGGVNKNVTIWDVSTRKRLFSLPGRSNPTAVAGSPDGRFWAWVMDDKLRVRQRTGKTDAWSRDLDAGPVTGLACSPDSQVLAWGDGEGKIWLCDAVTGRGIRTLRSHGSAVSGVAFHPEGKRLVSASADGTFCLWNVT